MKYRLAVVPLILLTASILIVGCPGNNNPTSPSNPGPPAPTATFTASNTPCMVGGTPCTSTFTFTPTATPTSTPTSTVTSTPTNTSSPTVTSTPTMTYTSYPTGTPCAIILTATPTNTVVTSNSISGTLTYSGTGSVDASHALYVGLYTDTCANSLIEYSKITSNGGSYLNYAPSSGTYYLAAFYDFNGLGSPNIVGLQPGDRYLIYNSGACLSCATSGTAISGATSGPNLTLTNNCTFVGIYGTATYTGNRGTVGICRQIRISTYSDAGYSTLVNSPGYVYVNGANYKIITIGGTTPVYVQAYFDADGSGTFSSGDPYINLGQLTPSTNGLLQNISFGDATIK